MKHIVLMAILCIAIFGQQIEQEGQITSVTLYRGQALVTRTIDLDKLPEGQHQLVVKNLPSAVQPTSLFANSNNDINIRSVRYRSQLTEHSPVEGLRKLQEEVKQIEKKMRQNQSEQSLLKQQEIYLAGLKSYTMSATKTEIQKNALNPQSLMEMMGYIFGETKRINQEKLNLAEEMIQLKEKLQIVQSEIRKTTSYDTKEVKEALIFFHKKSAEEKSQINVGYLVNNSTWSPNYNIRSKSDESNIIIEYNALVQQTSGENWSNVSLTLSTASIEMSAESPSLSLMNLQLQADNQVQNTALSHKYSEFKNEQENILKSRSKMNQAEQIQANSRLNEIGNNIQILEIVGASSQNSNMTMSSGLTVHYDINGKVNIPSNTDQQIVEIKKLSLKQEIYNVNIPLLFENMYRKVKIKNTYEIALLGGNANVYLDGQFVGNAFLPMTAKGQKFTFGLGVDTQLQTTRELVSKKEFTERGNKVMILEYRLSFDNYKEEPIDVRIFDRVPKSNENLNVIVDSKVPLSKDEKYQAGAKNSGILRWDVSIPEESKLETPYTIEYSIRLEFAKEMYIVAPFLENNDFSQKKNYRSKDMYEEESLFGSDSAMDYAEESLDDF